jgi:hypothetical protein
MPEQSFAAAAGCTCAASGTGKTKAQHAIASNRNFMKLRVHHFSVHLVLELNGAICGPSTPLFVLLFLTKSPPLHKVRSTASRFVFSYRCQV